MNKIKVLLFIFRFKLLMLSVLILRGLMTVIPQRRGKNNGKILFLEVYPRNGAGYNYRVEKWRPYLEKVKIESDSMFLIEDSDDFFQQIGERRLKSFIIKTGWIRLRQIIKARRYRLVIVRRSVVLYNTYGNHAFEKLLRTVNKNIVLDFDDDIAGNLNSEGEERTFFQRILRHDVDYFNNSLAYYPSFIAGSNYLAELVLFRRKGTSSKDVLVLPTCVDYLRYEPKRYETNRATIRLGWIGGNQNLFLLESILPDLEQISKANDIELILICGLNVSPFVTSFPIVLRRYSIEREIEFLREIDIGLMPLLADDVSKGKCGFKLLQYMGLGIPGVASAITVNTEIIDDGKNGWLVKDDNWIEVLEKVVKSRDNWAEIGKLARQKVDKQYSFDANFEKLHTFLKNKGF